ncbi:ABC transporter ATPase and inner membrane protein [Psychromonas ingrahamii 37]|uniref:ABC transporter ATPase and inner membrane protein n=1 Tax=Psychromonas ingrahamii (strain DSM 17664 / CCUG 51855 / 37) TaxID=357804 RepID=A1SY11_PSYIN|nr:ABC transporter ATP-binding protein [Psychromonas ingrahamii]ABM04376.1 ABC transporter ATPase and inner membrane protein [Psychromonas ingrahamii 37]
MTQFSILLSLFKQYWFFAPKLQCIALVLMVVQGISSGIGILLIIPLLEVLGIYGEASSTNAIILYLEQAFNTLTIELNLINVLVSYVVIVSIIATIKFQLSRLTVRLQHGYIRHLRSGLYHSLLNAKWEFIIQHKMTDFIHTLTMQVQAMGQSASLIMNLLSQFILVGILFFFALFVSWELTISVFLFTTIIYLALLPFNKKLFNSGKLELVNYKQIFQMVNEQLASLKMIKSYGVESNYSDKLSFTSSQLEQQQIEVATVNALTQWLYLIITVISFSVFFYFGSQLIEVSALFALLLLYSRLLPQVIAIQSNYQRLIHKVPAFNDIEQMFNACIKAQESTAISLVSDMAFENKIQLKKVSFHYPDKIENIIVNLDLIINKNETWAFVAQSGRGKTTLADIITGLLLPQKGSIQIDEQTLSGDNCKAWRKNIAYITQDVYLFNDTIRANLSWVSSGVFSDTEIWKKLELAAAKDFVENLPLGLDSIIGDRGVRLSGGERQRLALARALLTNPKLLILDEATSALDLENEKKIQQALRALKGQTTMIIIAHRESTQACADHTLHL